MSEEGVILKIVPAALLASYKMTVPRNEQVPDYFEKAHQALWAFVREKHLKVIGPHMTIWHQGPEVVENEVVEVTFEIDAAVAGEGKIQVYILPETQVAAFVHRGDFKDFQIGHRILMEWIKEHDYRATGGYREIYLEHHPRDLSHSVTEIQFPVEKLTTNHLENT